MGGTGFVVLASLKTPPKTVDYQVRQFAVDVFKAERSTIRHNLMAFGTARAERTVVISAQVAGRVVATVPELRVGLAVEGPAVKPGTEDQPTRDNTTTLVQIDPRMYEERVVQVENRIGETRLELERLAQEELNLDRLRNRIDADLADSLLELKKSTNLREKNISTDSDVRRAQMDVRQYEKLAVQNENEKELLPVRRATIERKLESLENELKLARLDLEHAAIAAPFKGRVSKVSVELGQYLKPGDPLLELVDLNVVEVPLSVTLDDYAFIAAEVERGTLPKVALADNESALPRWQGEIVRVAPVADEQTRTVKVFARVDNAPQTSPLLPGTFVHARIAGPVLNNTVLVPRDAVVGDQVFLARGPVAKKVSVSTGIILQSLVAITAGVTAGDAIIMSNLDALSDGASITVRSEGTLEAELARQRVVIAQKLAD